MPKDVGSLDMIRSAVDFRAMQANSRSRTHPLLLLRYRRNELDRTRYGISTGRRIGTAVVRNTVRRRIREIVRRCDALLRAPGEPASGRDILIVARPASAQASFADLQASLLSLLRAIPVTPAEIAP